jgi:hypothetical protein
MLRARSDQGVRDEQRGDDDNSADGPKHADVLLYKPEPMKVFRVRATE